MSLKINRFDESVSVLYTEIIIATEIYEHLRIQANNKDRILDHKISCQNLIDEIDRAVSKISFWIRGKDQVKDLIEIKYLIVTYKELVFARNLEEAKVRFDTNFHKFFSLLEQLKCLFD